MRKEWTERSRKRRENVKECHDPLFPTASFQNGRPRPTLVQIVLTRKPLLQIKTSGDTLQRNSTSCVLALTRFSQPIPNLCDDVCEKETCKVPNRCHGTCQPYHTQHQRRPIYSVNSAIAAWRGVGDFVLQLQRESPTKLRPTNDRRRKLISDNYSNNLIQFRDDGVDPFLYSRLRRLEDNDRLSMHRTNESLCFHQIQEPVRISWPQLRLASTEKT